MRVLSESGASLFHCLSSLEFFLLIVSMHHGATSVVDGQRKVCFFKSGHQDRCGCNPLHDAAIPIELCHLNHAFEHF